MSIFKSIDIVVNALRAIAPHHSEPTYSPLHDMDSMDESPTNNTGSVGHSNAMKSQNVHTEDRAAQLLDRSDEDIIVSPMVNRRLLKKIDLRIVPIMLAVSPRLDSMAVSFGSK